jgi:hypothetical protein
MRTYFPLCLPLVIAACFPGVRTDSTKAPRSDETDDSGAAVDSADSAATTDTGTNDSGSGSDTGAGEDTGIGDDSGIVSQSPYTGVYMGTLTVSGQYEYNGTPGTTDCIGAITLVVDVNGTTVSGDATCPMNLFGFEVDSRYDFVLDNTDGAMSGPAEAEFYGFGATNFDATGEVTLDGAMTATFSGDVFGFLAIDGSFEATRVTRDVTGA